MSDQHRRRALVAHQHRHQGNGHTSVNADSDTTGRTNTDTLLWSTAEGFTDITTLVPGGWFMQNNSQPGPGLTGWFQGNTAVFNAQGGARDLVHWNQLQQRHGHIDFE